jgi:hypothetical protein
MEIKNGTYNSVSSLDVFDFYRFSRHGKSQKKMMGTQKQSLLCHKLVVKQWC